MFDMGLNSNFKYGLMVPFAARPMVGLCNGAQCTRKTAFLFVGL